MNSDSAKSGFKTFILTLSISLIVFSVVYYLVTSRNTDVGAAPYQAAVETKVDSAPLAAANTTTPDVQGISDESVFAGLSDAAVTANTLGSGNVLAGATSSPQTTKSSTTVPETGIVGITAGLLVSLVFFLTGMYYISSNPRKAALTGFEKDILKKN